MKQYLPALLILSLALVLIWREGMKSVRETTQLRSEIAATKVAMQTAQSRSAKKETELLRTTSLTRLEEFSETYAPALSVMRDVAAINQIVNAEAESLLLPVQEQRTETRYGAGRVAPGKMTPHKSKAAPAADSTEPDVLIYSVGVSGEFSATLEWLGRIEAALPLARIERIEITPSQDWVNVRCSLALPEFAPAKGGAL